MKLSLINQNPGISNQLRCFFLAGFIFFLLNEPAQAGSLNQALETSASGMKAQSERIKIITENIANSDTTALSSGANPYRRKTIYFEQQKNKETGANLVKVRKIGTDNSDFKLIYQPNHPAADAAGYVKYPNVDRSLESMDLREAQRNYEANITAIEITRGMMERSVDLMR